MFNNNQSLSIGEVPKNDAGMMNILINADLLVIPFDYSKKSIERIRLSMLAKVSAYLASGTPILVFGSEKIATVEYAIKEKWAHVLVDNDREQLKNMIIELIKNTELRNSTIKIAKKVVIKDFDAKIIKEDFRRQIQTTIIN
jgi:glycosyltransferase involved in cell wall biosynthesis